MRVPAILMLAAVLTSCAAKEDRGLPTETDVAVQQEADLQLDEAQMLAEIGQKADIDEEKHVYEDFDGDGLSEMLLVSGQSGSVYETWFCSYDGAVCKLIDTTEEPWDEVMISTVAQADGIHAAVSYQLIMGTYAHSTIYRFDGGEPTPIVQSCHPVYCPGDGSVLLQREDYDITYDPSIDTMLGHSYKSTFLGYDDGGYFEYRAEPVPLKTVRQMDGSDALFSQIKADGCVPSKAFLRGNGYGYVQCGNPEADRKALREGSYCYYTFTYTDNRMTALIPGVFGGYSNDGIMTDHFSDLPVR